MKRIIAVIVTLFLLCLIYEFGVLLFLKHYEYKYMVTKDKTDYEIIETYNYNNKNHLYDIKITDKKNTFTYLVNHNFNKEKSIIKDLVIYDKNNTKCILPIFKDNIVGDIKCSLNDKIITYNYLEQINNSYKEELKEYIINKGYKLPIFDNKERTTKKLTSSSTSLSYYTDFIPNYNVLVWNYKGVFSINKEKEYINEFLKFDVYDSKYIEYTNKNMYIMNINTNNSNFDQIYAVDIKDGKQTIIDVLEESISTNSYFNGAYNDNVYFFDINNNKQYMINSKNTKVEITSKENKIKYYDGNKMTYKKIESPLANNNIIFNEEQNKEITKLYNTSDIRKSNNHYYFRTSDGNIYMCLENDYKNPTLLFQKTEFKDWKVCDDTIFGISGNDLYAYNYSYGLKPIVNYSEFTYNTSKMYGVIKIK